MALQESFPLSMFAEKQGAQLMSAVQLAPRAALPFWDDVFLSSLANLFCTGHKRAVLLPLTRWAALPLLREQHLSRCAMLHRAIHMHRGAILLTHRATLSNRSHQNFSRLAFLLQAICSRAVNRTKE